MKWAFRDVDKLMFVSTTAFTDALIQHRNVVEAATTAGVRHVYYTGIQRPEGSTFAISQVTQWDLETETALAGSGMAVTLLRNTMYLDALPSMLSSKVLVNGLRAPAGTGIAALAARHELAEAAAILLSQPGHVGKSYTLGGSTTTSLAEIAAILSRATARDISYTALSRTDFISERSAEGLPDFVASFIGEWFEAIGAGEFAEVTGELEAILGRKPTECGRLCAKSVWRG